MSTVALATAVSTVGAHDYTTINTPHGQITMPASQVVDGAHPAGFETVKNLTSQTASVAPGVYADFVINPTDIGLLRQVWLQVNLGAISGVTGGTGASFVDGNWLLQRFEVYIGSTVLDTVFPEANWVRDLLTYSNEEKARLNRAGGTNTLAARQTAAASAQTLYLRLRSFWDVGRGFLVRKLSAPIRIRVYFDTAQNVTQLNSGTGTPTFSINSVSLYILGRDWHSQNTLANAVANAKKVKAITSRYLSPWQMLKQSLISGSTNYSINLTSFTGAVSHLYFMVRYASSVAGAYTNTPDSTLALSQYALTLSSGQIIPGGSAIPSSLDELVVSKAYFPGDGTNLSIGLGTAAPANVYVLSFSSAPVDSETEGRQKGFWPMDGTQILQISFASSLASNAVVDVIAQTWQSVVVDQNGNAIKQ